MAQIQQGGGKAEFVRTDVSKEDDVAAHRRASSPANTKNRKEKFIDNSCFHFDQGKVTYRNIRRRNDREGG